MLGFGLLQDFYYIGLKYYLYDCGGSLLQLQYNGHQNPILIIKHPILQASYLGM